MPELIELIIDCIIVACITFALALLSGVVLW